MSLTRELVDVAGRPFTAAEVEDAVAYFVGVSPLRYATADGVADQAATQVLAGLPDDYVDRSLALLRDVTPESATEAYASLVRVDELSLVVVGDAATHRRPAARRRLRRPRGHHPLTTRGGQFPRFTLWLRGSGPLFAG